ncbi:MAG: C40 family peptidase [Capnocytophaga sp.]|nr:C40 family peptidase [Capnocytophaga sp.]
MFAICYLSIIPVRLEPSHKSEQVTQMLYGETCIITKKNNDGWCYVRIDFDNYEGWVNQKQLQLIDEITYYEIKDTLPRYAADLFDFVQLSDNEDDIQTITLGATVSNAPALGHIFRGEIQQGVSRKNLIKLAFQYLNAPYLWGGKTPLGIDCSGLTQMVYKLSGVALPRDASEQAKLGTHIQHLSDSEIGDLAFFNNDAGRITHTGIILGNGYIIHAHGKVRVDRINENGIFNLDNEEYTHKLRMIRRFLYEEKKN